MAGNADDRGILYITRDRFDFYSPSLPGVIQCPLAPTLIKDLEILNEQGLYIQIKSFIETHRIKPMQLLLVLSEDITFERDYIDRPDFDRNQAIQHFQDTLPFEEITMKLYKVDKGLILIGINRHLYEPVSQSFQKLGFVTEGIIPQIITRRDTTMSNTLDIASAVMLLSKFDLYREDSVLTHQATPIEPEKKETYESEDTQKQSNSRLFLLVGVFILLIGLLGYVYMQSQTPPPPPKNSTPPVAVTPKEQLITMPTLTQVPIGSASAQKLDTLKIQIINASGTLGIDETVKNQISTLGFQNIETKSDTTTTSQNVILVFSKNVLTETRDRIYNLLKTTYPTIAIQETFSSQYDITVIIGKQK